MRPYGKLNQYPLCVFDLQFKLHNNIYLHIYHLLYEIVYIFYTRCLTVKISDNLKLLKYVDCVN